MGKAPEAIDDLLMSICVVEVLAEPEPREQLDGARLHRAIFGVLKRHVEKQALLRCQLLVESRCDCMLCNGQRQRVRRERARRAAEQVAWKLIEGDHRG